MSTYNYSKTDIQNTSLTDLPKRAAASGFTNARLALDPTNPAAPFKIIVDEDGVRGTGPSADRVKKIFEQFRMDIES